MAREALSPVQNSFVRPHDVHERVDKVTTMHSSLQVLLSIPDSCPKSVTLPAKMDHTPGAMEAIPAGCGVQESKPPITKGGNLEEARLWG